LKLNDINILGGSAHTIKKNTEDLIVSIKAIGLEVNADKPKYMFMFPDQNAGGSHSITTIIGPLIWWKS
jgi:hypothetical protein